MYLRKWIDVHEPLPGSKNRLASAREILGVTRTTLDAWLAGKYAPKERRRFLFASRTGWCVRPEGFGPGEVAR